MGLDQEDAAFVCISIIIFVFGILANLFVIALLMIEKKFLKSSTHWYVLQLAIADTLFLFTVPFNVLQVDSDVDFSSDSSCKVFSGTLYINFFASILFLTVMSVDRYVAVCHRYTNFAHNVKSFTASCIITGAVWIISILVSLPVILYTKSTRFGCESKFPYYDYDRCLDSAENETDCDHLKLNEMREDSSGLEGSGGTSPNVDEYKNDTECTLRSLPKSLIIYNWFNFLVFYIFPIIVLTVCYIKIIIQIWYTPSPGGADGGSHHDGPKREKKKITYVCIVLILVFVACWLPYYVREIGIVYGFNLTSKQCRGFHRAGLVLIFLNSSLNPYLYNILGIGLKRKWKLVKQTALVSRIIQRITSQ